MIVRAKALAAATVLTLAGCAQEKAPQTTDAVDPAPQPDPKQVFIAKVEETVRYGLKDSASAQFKQIKAYPTLQLACGRLNAKNSFGGYTGFERFVFDHGRAITEGQDDHVWRTADKKCVDAGHSEVVAERERLLASLPQSIAALRANKTMSDAAKAPLIAGMEQSLEELQRDAFGNP